MYWVFPVGGDAGPQGRGGRRDGAGRGVEERRSGKGGEGERVEGSRGEGRERGRGRQHVSFVSGCRTAGEGIKRLLCCFAREKLACDTHRCPRIACQTATRSRTAATDTRR